MKIQETNVYVLLFNQDRVLLLRRKDGIWEFPGGSVEWGEHPEDSAIRELQEETGISVQKPLRFMGVTSAVYKKGENEKHSIYLVYAAETKNMMVKLSKEHDEYRWLNKTEIGFIRNTLNIGLNAEPIIDMI
ncbi:MAG: NUDIX hydrolase [Candidatus Bilamarchaeaceae archaeon]